MSEIYNAYSDDFRYGGEIDSIPWEDGENTIGENVALDKYARAKETISSFTTQTLMFDFDKASMEAVVSSGAVIDSVVFNIKWKISSLGNGSASFKTFKLFNETLDLGYNATSDSEITYILGIDAGIKTAEYVFSGLNTPLQTDLVEDGFSCGITFDVSGDGVNELQVEIYEVLVTVNFSNGIPSISVYNNDFGGTSLPIDTNLNFQDLSIGAAITTTFTVTNTGNSNLVLSKDGIYVTFGGYINILNTPTSSGAVNLLPESSINVTVSLNRSSEGSFPDQYVFFTSNDPTNPVFYIRISFTVGLFTSQAKISVIQNGIGIVNGETASIPAVPKDIPTSITFIISNSGSSDLIVNNISTTGDGTIGGGSLSNGTSIEVGKSANLNLDLIVTSFGNKRIIISLITNDSENNPYIITLNYTVLAQAGLEFTSGGESLENGTSFSLGTLDKGETFTKTYTLKNNGIYKSVIINSITSSGDTVIQSKPTLPLILFPSSANSGTFVIAFPALNVGLKNGSITIDWEEAP